MNHFSVSGFVDSRPVSYEVVAKTALQAVQICLARHPEMDITDLSHQGRVDVIDGVGWC